MNSWEKWKNNCKISETLTVRWGLVRQRLGNKSSYDDAGSTGDEEGKGRKGKGSTRNECNQRWFPRPEQKRRVLAPGLVWWWEGSLETRRSLQSGRGKNFLESQVMWRTKEVTSRHVREGWLGQGRGMRQLELELVERMAGDSWAKRSVCPILWTIGTAQRSTAQHRGWSFKWRGIEIPFLDSEDWLSLL
jgi:hypothetical protein